MAQYWYASDGSGYVWRLSLSDGSATTPGDFGTSGLKDETYSWKKTSAIDASRNVYFTTSASTVSKYAPDGTKQWETTSGGGGNVDAVLAPDGDDIIVHRENDGWYLYDKSTGSQNGATSTNFQTSLSDATILQSGEILAAVNATGGPVKKISYDDAAGSFSEVATKTVVTSTGYNRTPLAVAQISDGRLLVRAKSNPDEIQINANDFSSVSYISISGNTLAPSGMRVDQNDKIYIGSGQGAFRYDINGNQEVVYSSTNQDWGQVQVTPNGKVLFQDLAGGNTKAYNTDGTSTFSAGSGGGDFVAFPDRYESPSSWSTVAKATATQVTASASMNSPAVQDEVAATQFTASASMESPSLLEFATATAVTGSALMESPSLTQFATATAFTGSASMNSPSAVAVYPVSATQFTAAGATNATTLTEFATGTQFTASASQLSALTSSLTLSADAVTASATPNATTLTNEINATAFTSAASMASPELLEFATASAFTASALMNAGKPLTTATATQFSATASMNAAQALLAAQQVTAAASMQDTVLHRERFGLILKGQSGTTSLDCTLIPVRQNGDRLYRSNNTEISPTYTLEASPNNIEGKFTRDKVNNTLRAPGVTYDESGYFLSQEHAYITGKPYFEGMQDIDGDGTNERYYSETMDTDGDGDVDTGGDAHGGFREWTQPHVVNRGYVYDLTAGSAEGGVKVVPRDNKDGNTNGVIEVDGVHGIDPAKNASWNSTYNGAAVIAGPEQSAWTDEGADTAESTAPSEYVVAIAGTDESGDSLLTDTVTFTTADVDGRFVGAAATRNDELLVAEANPRGFYEFNYTSGQSVYSLPNDWDPAKSLARVINYTDSYTTYVEGTDYNLVDSDGDGTLDSIEITNTNVADGDNIEIYYPTKTQELRRFNTSYDKEAGTISVSLAETKTLDFSHQINDIAVGPNGTTYVATESGTYTLSGLTSIDQQVDSRVATNIHFAPGRVAVAFDVYHNGSRTWEETPYVAVYDDRSYTKQWEETNVTDFVLYPSHTTFDYAVWTATKSARQFTASAAPSSPDLLEIIDAQQVTASASMNDTAVEPTDFLNAEYWTVPASMNSPEVLDIVFGTQFTAQANTFEAFAANIRATEASATASMHDATTYSYVNESTDSIVPAVTLTDATGTIGQGETSVPTKVFGNVTTIFDVAESYTQSQKSQVPAATTSINGTANTSTESTLTSPQVTVLPLDLVAEELELDSVLNTVDVTVLQSDGVYTVPVETDLISIDARETGAIAVIAGFQQDIIATSRSDLVRVYSDTPNLDLSRVSTRTIGSQTNS